MTNEDKFREFMMYQKRHAEEDSFYRRKKEEPKIIPYKGVDLNNLSVDDVILLTAIVGALVLVLFC